MKSTWKTTRSILGGKSTRGIKSIIVNRENVDDEKIIADEFNNYFASVVSEFDNQLPRSTIDPINYLTVSVVPSMFVTPVTAGEINDVVLSLKRKSNRANNLPLNMLISCRGMLCGVMAFCVSDSFDTGSFPQLLKRAEIIPVFKSGDPKLTYSPISVLRLLSKIYEKWMHSRLVSPLDRHSVLSVSQYGFRK